MTKSGHPFVLPNFYNLQPSSVICSSGLKVYRKEFLVSPVVSCPLRGDKLANSHKTKHFISES